MQKFKEYLMYSMALTIITLAILLNAKGCGDTIPVPAEKEYILVPGQDIITHDTIKPKAEKTNKPWIKPTPPSYPQPEYSLCLSHNEYSDSLVDSNQVIYWKIVSRGPIDSLKVDYKLFIPLMIKETITRVDTMKFLPKPNKWILYAGMELGGNKEKFNISPEVTLVLKNKVLHYRYGATDETHNIGVDILIFRSKR